MATARTHSQDIEVFERHVKELSRTAPCLEILEAGCGQQWPLKLKAIDYKLTGVDIDETALEIRVNKTRDLDKAVVCDLRELNLPKHTFDVIYSAFVLEHVHGAERVLDKFDEILKPGGLLILRIPDRYTVFGTVTRFAPFWLQVAYAKYVRDMPDAGKAGYGPYPVVYDKIISRKGIADFCRSHHYDIKYEKMWGGYLRKKSFKTQIVKLVAISISLLSLGILPWRHNNLSYVLQKRVEGIGPQLQAER